MQYKIFFIVNMFFQLAMLNSMASGVLNTSTVKQLHSEITNGKYGKVSSVIVMQNSKVIFERYYGFSQVNTLHPISSVTKSITSLAIGICLDKGLITSIDEPISKFLPEFSTVYMEQPHKSKIVIRHLLNQTSGFDWDEWTIHYSYAGNQLVNLSHYTGNWVDYIMNLPLKTEPGNVFNYNSGNSELLKEIVCRVSGTDFIEFVNSNLLIPLGISNFYWEGYSGNRQPAWGGLSLTSRDMLKFGLIMLNNGKYGGKQIVSNSWVTSSSYMPVDAGNSRYGLHWWVNYLEATNEPFYYAAGYGDQYIFILPSKSMVVAVNAQNFTDFKFEKSIIDMFKMLVNSITN